MVNIELRRLLASINIIQILPTQLLTMKNEHFMSKHLKIKILNCFGENSIH